MKRLLILLALTACVSTAQLDVPEGWWDVEGSNPRVWNEPISFGPYRTEMVAEGTRRSWLADLNILSVGRIDQGTRLRIAGIGVECHTRQLLLGRNEIYVDPALGRAALMVCGYEKGGSRSMLTLSRTGRTDAWLTGEVRFPGRGPLELRSLHMAKGARFRSGDTLGFEILDRGERVAMVETMNRGRVWIDESAGDRDLLAAVAASLLLFRDPDGDFMQ